jgi:hypothetical protein
MAVRTAPASMYLAAFCTGAGAPGSADRGDLAGRFLSLAVNDLNMWLP